MNPSEQKNHKTALATLGRETADAFDALTSRLGEEHRKVVEFVTKEIGQERTHRLKLADEQRSYVDAQDRELRRDMEATDRLLNQRFLMLESLTLWGRIRWMVTGRLS